MASNGRDFPVFSCPVVFRAQWYFQMTTRRDFPVKVRPVDTYFTRWTSVSLRGHLFATPPDATDATDASDTPPSHQQSTGRMHRTHRQAISNQPAGCIGHTAKPSAINRQDASDTLNVSDAPKRRIVPNGRIECIGRTHRQTIATSLRQASDKPADKPAINRRTDMREIFSVIAQDFIIYYCDEFIIFVCLMLLIDTD